MKQFDSLGGAHKYAENSSRKHSEDRWVIKALNTYYVVGSANDIDDLETIVAHYKNGEKML